MGSRKPSPSRSPASAEKYLVHERGLAVGAEIIGAARVVAEVLRAPPRPLDSSERKRAKAAALVIRPLVDWYDPGALSMIDRLIADMGHPPKRGRRRGVAAEFSRGMLWWGASELGSRGLRQLTASELMAAAVAVKIEPATDPADALDKDDLDVASEQMLNTWSKHYRQGLPADPLALASAWRAKMNKISADSMVAAMESAFAARGGSDRPPLRLVHSTGRNSR